MREGLKAQDGWFWINGERTRLFSGAIHYFRVPHQYWRDRMLKLRNSGCNVLETYATVMIYKYQLMALFEMTLGLMNKIVGL